jgi:hypothetical protein
MCLRKVIVEDLAYTVMMAFNVISGYGLYCFYTNYAKIDSASDNWEEKVKVQIMNAFCNTLIRIIDGIICSVASILVLLYGPWRLTGMITEMRQMAKIDKYSYTPICLRAACNTIFDIPYVLGCLFLILSVYGGVKLNTKLNEKEIYPSSDTFETDMKHEIS